MKSYRIGTLSLCVGLVFALSGCAKIAAIGSAPVATESVVTTPQEVSVCTKSAAMSLSSDSNMERILDYSAALGRFTTAQLQEQSKLVKVKFAENPANDLERFRLILLLIHAPAFREYKAAATLLDDYIKHYSDKDPLLNSFATILSVTLKDQINIAERESALERKLASSDKNLKLLQSQLDALKTIETSIHQRDLGEGQQ